MFLNNFRLFLVVTFLTIGIYYFQHIRTSEFVFEDSHWIEPHSWSINDLVIPSNKLTLLTFIGNTSKIAHSINLSIHIINGLLIGILFNWIVAALFILNPISIQAVAYASGRGELLSLMFLLGFLWFVGH